MRGTDGFNKQNNTKKIDLSLCYFHFEFCKEKKSISPDMFARIPVKCSSTPQMLPLTAAAILQSARKEQQACTVANAMSAKVLEPKAHQIKFVTFLKHSRKVVKADIQV